MVLISLATVEDISANVVSYASSPYQSLMAGVATDAETIGPETNDDEEVVHSYKVMYERPMKALSENKVLHKQIS